MKQKTARKLLIVLLSLALALGLMPGMRLTAHAANTTWSESFTAEGGSIHGGVTVSDDITVTIPEGVKLSVLGGIDASGRTLTVEGGGTLNVMGVPGGDGETSGVNGSDATSEGGCGFTGNLVVNGPAVYVYGGEGGEGGDGNYTVGNGGHGGNGSKGGVGVTGDVTVKSGRIHVEGGRGGDGGVAADATNGGDGGNGGNGGKAGDGGVGVYGNVTVERGSAEVNGGTGGLGGAGGKGTSGKEDGNDGEAGQAGRAVTGTITGRFARESVKTAEGDWEWADLSGNTSEMQSVQVDSIRVTLAPSDKQTVEIGAVISFTATVESDDGMIPSVIWNVNSSNVALYSRPDCAAGTEVGTAPTTKMTVYAKGISAGDATVIVTSHADRTKGASCDVTVPSRYIVSIPATLNVAQAGWNPSAGIGATGSLAFDKELTVTADSRNGFALVNANDSANRIPYKLTELTESDDAPPTYDSVEENTTVWKFSSLDEELETQSMGVVVDDYSEAVPGEYTDTVTFTAALIDSCVAEGTLITLADGTQVPIETLKVGDLVQTWSFWNGRYEAQPVTVVINHGVDEYTVHSLVFSDGTVVETINGHGFYSPDLNDYAFITPDNVDKYVGGRFVLQSKDGGHEIVTLVESRTEIREVGCYSLLTAHNYNFMAENMLSITMEYRPGCFHFFDIGDNMAYDPDKMAQDIARYGLYTAEDFSEYVTPEQFDMLSGPYYKVLVGKGTVNDGDIVSMIERYLGEGTE